MELNNYDKTASFYDFLSRLVFFRSQVDAQIAQLKYIPAGSRILIVGGGTGWILEELTKIHNESLEISFVEISGKMLAKAKKRNVGMNKVAFVHSGIESFTTKDPFDVVQTAFLFDNFSKPRIIQVFHQLNDLLKPGGLWLFSDFRYQEEKTTLWQAMILKIMYLFFRTISNVEAETLSDMMPYFHAKGYHLIAQEHYYQNFIQSNIFQKSGKIPTFIPNLQP
jgi:ubiquinone/menaquinone biosynthesis C-methylase UbiE